MGLSVVLVLCEALNYALGFGRVNDLVCLVQNELFRNLVNMKQGHTVFRLRESSKDNVIWISKESERRNL
jgi:hypothetical protein